MLSINTGSEINSIKSNAQMQGTFSINQLYDAYLSCARNKPGKKPLLLFQQNLEENLFNLLNELNTNSYKISKPSVFTVSDPKLREIWASCFRDRVVHHLAVNAIEPFYEDKKNSFSFLGSSYSCRKGKGTHKGALKAQNLIRKNKYFIQLDISSFFNSISKKILLDILSKDLECVPLRAKKETISLLGKIVMHSYTKDFYCHDLSSLKKIPLEKSLFSSEKKEKGLPTGNLTSQFLANVYLNRLDNYVINGLGCKDCIRYVDDLLLFSDNPEKLKYFEMEINSFLKKELKLCLNSNKAILAETSKGIDFLGYYIKPTHTLVRKRVVNSLKKKKHSLSKKPKTIINLKKAQAVYNSYFGHFESADSFNLKLSFHKSLEEDFMMSYKKNNWHLKPRLKDNFKTSWEQYNFFRSQYPDALILFQKGIFYRLYNEQARFISNKMGLRLVMRKNHCLCGFPLESKKLETFKSIGCNYVIIAQLGHELKTGIRERIVKEKCLNSRPFFFNPKNPKHFFGIKKTSQSPNGEHPFSPFGFYDRLSLSPEKHDKESQLKDILSWDLENMTPLETYRKLSCIIENER